MSRRAVIIALSSTGLFACSATPHQGTLAELDAVPADIDEIYVADSLERAAHG